jgi:predicted alpha/beta-hydrolase family hydrolase
VAGRTPSGLLVLGHGAGGGIDAGDLRAAAASAQRAGWAVARVLQPYRVLGRRSPAPAGQLDAAWLAVVAALRKRPTLTDVPLVVGGRSSGARVACRTVAEARARAVGCLAFPLHPPGRPDRTRAEELRGVAVPVVIVQGERDAFGGPAELATLRMKQVEIHAVTAADHGLRGAEAHRLIDDAVTGLLARVS